MSKITPIYEKHPRLDRGGSKKCTLETFNFFVIFLKRKMEDFVFWSEM